MESNGNKDSRQNQKPNKIKAFFSNLANRKKNRKKEGNSSEDIEQKKIVQSSFWTNENINTTSQVFLAITTMILALYTYKLFNEASTQSKISERIDSLSTKRFDIENEPYLQIDSVSNIKIPRGEPNSFDYLISNLGKSPVKITYAKLTVSFLPKDYPIPNNIENLFDNVTVGYSPNKYLISNIPLSLHWTASGIISNEDFDKVMINHTLCQFVSGIINYTNLVTGQ
jgi:hypothetical protein